MTTTNWATAKYEGLGKMGKDMFQLNRGPLMTSLTDSIPDSKTK